MSDYLTESGSWRSSTSMILWGIVVLTVFGCVASFCEFFFSPLDTAKGYLDSLFNMAVDESDQTHAEGFFKFYEVHGRLGIWTRIAELLTIGGWIVYVVGLSKFRDAQGSDKGRWLASGLYSACWLGLVGMACSFIGSFLGVFGILFRFAGWILNLISLFKFRGAFNQFSIEESWNELARRGAATLRSSYTFGIILAFYPIIVFLIAVFIGLGSISNLSSILKGMGTDEIDALIALATGSALIFILLALVAVVLWILQVCYLIGGWCKIYNGGLAEEENQQPADYSVTMTIGSILGTLVLLGLVVWTCSAPVFAKADSYHIGPMEEAVAAADEGSVSEGNHSSEISYKSSTAGELTYHEAAPAENQEEENPGCGEDIVNYKGFIDGKYGIEMSIEFGSFTGEYFYTKNKRPIQLRGEIVDDSHLVLKEYVGNDMTGIFDGVLTGNTYHGTWTSADGARSYPFEVTEI